MFVNEIIFLLVSWWTDDTADILFSCLLLYVHMSTVQEYPVIYVWMETITFL